MYADAARWEQLSAAAAGGRLGDMLELTPEAREQRDSLDKNDPEYQAKKSEIEKSMTSYQYPVGSEAEQQAYFEKTGVHIPVRHAFDRGVPGSHDTVHAERILRVSKGAQAIGVVGQPMCDRCQVWFREAAAAAVDGFIVVFDGDVMRVFTQDGIKGPENFK
jgi:hypothetical protein